MPFDAALVRSLVDEIEGLRARQRQLSEDIKAVISRGRSEGIDGRALRAALTRRGWSPELRRRIDGQVATIENALAESGGTSVIQMAAGPPREAVAVIATPSGSSAERRGRGRPRKDEALIAALDRHKDALAPLPLLAQARFLAAHGVASPITCRLFLQRRASAAPQECSDAAAAA